jgi:hypothetical protein
MGLLAGILEAVCSFGQRRTSFHPEQKAREVVADIVKQHKEQVSMVRRT